jgi:hypothetical protein
MSSAVISIFLRLRGLGFKSESVNVTVANIDTSYFDTMLVVAFCRDSVKG